jgi:hypothetical protein
MTTVMTVSMLLAWAGGREWREVTTFLAAAWVPEFAACLLPLGILRALRDPRRKRSSDVMLLMRFVADLRAGATMRSVIGDSGDDPGLEAAASMARSGRPMSQVLAAAEPAFGRHGDLVGSALRVAASTGGSVAPVVEQLVAQVMALDALDDERRAAIAPVLLQALIVGGVPLVTLVTMAFSGRLAALAATGGWHASVVVSGSTLVLLGASSVGWLARRSSR